LDGFRVAGGQALSGGMMGVVKRRVGWGGCMDEGESTCTAMIYSYIMKSAVTIIT